MTAAFPLAWRKNITNPRVDERPFREDGIGNAVFFPISCSGLVVVGLICVIWCKDLRRERIERRRSGALSQKE
jgi:hypothetical protein